MAGIIYQTFAYWRQELRKANAGLELSRTTSPQGLRHVQATLQAPLAAPARCSLRVTLPGGVQMMITDAAQVSLASQLIQAFA